MAQTAKSTGVFRRRHVPIDRKLRVILYPAAAAAGMLFRHPGMTGRMQDLVGGMKA